MKYTEITSPAQKRIALVAHDHQKPKLIQWCQQHQATLSQHSLYGTGTTGTQVNAATGLQVQSLLSGPLGGDQQIGAKISEGEIDMLIFFWDPFEPMPHDPDVKALLRVAAVWNIPVACNQASADMLLSSTLMGESYSRSIPDYAAYLAERTD